MLNLKNKREIFLASLILNYYPCSLFVFTVPEIMRPSCATEEAGTRRISLSPPKIPVVERDTLYLHATSFNSRGTSSATEESRCAHLHPPAASLLCTATFPTSIPRAEIGFII